MNLWDLAPNILTVELLKENGYRDAKRGIDQHTGWQSCAKECGLNPHQHTPAQEAYLDGYYSYCRDGAA